MTSIYAIINKGNDKTYIGQTINIKRRWSTHKTHLRRGKHSNPHLQNAWNSYGERAFEFVVIDMDLDPKEADRVEQLYIRWYRDLGLSYNTYWAQDSFKRHPMSDEMKRHLSRTHKERGTKPPSRKGCKQPPMTEAQKEAIRIANHKRAEENAEERIIPNCPICGESCKIYYHKGKFHRILKTCGKQQCKTALIGPLSQATRAKIADAKRGKPLSEAHREKQSKSMKAYMAKKTDEEKQEWIARAHKGLADRLTNDEAFKAEHVNRAKSHLGLNA